MLRTALLLAVLLVGPTLALATAAAHPIHDGCNPPQVWAGAYVQQLGRFTVTWGNLFGVPFPMVNSTGDPYSGIVCIP